MSHDPGPATQVVPVAAVPSTTAPATPPRPVTPPAQFPRRAEYWADIPLHDGAIALTVTVDGTQTTAYACDNEGIDVWLRGRTGPGTLALASWDRSSSLDGRLEGDRITGTLWIAERRWQYRTSAAQVTDNGY